MTRRPWTLPSLSSPGREGSSMLRHLTTILLLLIVTLPALADTVKTTSGGRITSKIVYEGDDAVKIKTDKGAVVSIPRDEVESIVKESLDDVFAKKLAKLAK